MIGVVLAGGKSTRFGSQKAFYEFNGKPFYEHVRDTMIESGLFEAVVINTNEQLAEYFSGNVIVDRTEYKELGPLAGIYTVMEELQSDSYFIVSVDTPLITKAALQHLVAAYKKCPGRIAVYQDYETLHPTIAIYPHVAKNRIKHLLDTKQLKVRALFDNETTYIDVAEVPGQWYTNINRPEDLAVLEEGD